MMVHIELNAQPNLDEVVDACRFIQTMSSFRSDVVAAHCFLYENTESYYEVESYKDRLELCYRITNMADDMVKDYWEKKNEDDDDEEKAG